MSFRDVSTNGRPMNNYFSWISEARHAASSGWKNVTKSIAGAIDAT